MKKTWHGTWHGRHSTRWIASIDELRQLIPTFTILDFRIGEGVNKYLNLIAREPLGEPDLGNEVNPMNSARIPVAAVRKIYKGSRLQNWKHEDVLKGYKLVQHHEVLESVLATLKAFSDKNESQQDSIFANSRFRILPLTDPEVLEATLQISDYGARMRFEFCAPNYQFYIDNENPFVLKVICLNSVDKSIALRIGLSVVRDSEEIFMAGFVRYHDQELEDGAIEAFLDEQFNRFTSGEWISRTIPEEEIETLITNHFRNVDFQKVKWLYTELLKALGEVESHVRQEAGKMNFLLVRQVLSKLASEQKTLHSQEREMAKVLDMLKEEEDRQSK